MLSEGEQDIQLHTEVSVLGSSSFIFNLGIIYWAVAMCPGNREAGHTLFHLFFVVVLLRSCVWLFLTPWTAAHQAPLSMGFPRQECWSGFPFLLHCLFLLMSNSHTRKFTHCACAIQWVWVNVERCAATPAILSQHDVVFIILFLWMITSPGY